MNLSEAPWISADIAYRRSALLATDGFDERFPLAFREDADLGLRTVRAGYAIVWGERVTTHPLASPNARRSSLRDQAGNAGNALLRTKYGPRWRFAGRYVTRTGRPSPDHHRRRDRGISGYVFQPRRPAACPRQLDSRPAAGWP
jgi:hypothetical protein